MKNTIKPFFPLIFTTLCTVCGLSILFHGISNTQNGIFSEIGNAFSNHTQNDNSTSVAKQISTQEKAPLPDLEYIGGTLTIGEANDFISLFTLNFPDGTHKSIYEEPAAALYLLDVTYADTSNDSSALTTLSADEITALEELPSSAIYDTSNKLLYFHKSGIYQLHLRLYYDYRPGVLFECRIPVETR